MEKVDVVQRPSKTNTGRFLGIGSALASAFFLGLTPFFGRQAILIGFSPLLVVALRTMLAALLMLVIMLIFRRSYMYIYPAGLIGCCIAGAINGLGSILYYLALQRLPASVGQLIYSLYPIFVAIIALFDGQRLGILTYIRMMLALGGIYLLTSATSNGIDWIGVILMLGASIMYAFHLPINQRVLYDVPAPTVTFYTLLSMSAIVIPAYLIFDRHLPISGTPWLSVFALSLVTFLSRIMLFTGIKHLGGMQTALLGISELFVTISVSHIWLSENLSFIQWIGALLLSISLLLIGFDRFTSDKRRPRGGWLSWIRSADVPPKIPWSPHD